MRAPMWSTLQPVAKPPRVTLGSTAGVTGSRRHHRGRGGWHPFSLSHARLCARAPCNPSSPLRVPSLLSLSSVVAPRGSCAVIWPALSLFPCTKARAHVCPMPAACRCKPVLHSEIDRRPVILHGGVDGICKPQILHQRRKRHTRRCGRRWWACNRDHR